ncbi:Glycogen [starch] synthase [Lachnellula willkommii]|uniref:Glycogen [starch] synthase n=1 Tax=Lachnellula willkommii TaxID=215461 RepID=A0A559MK51_9HELO|nr:Glycogen [starch] synthase [Lachnellula willkommii]
MAQHDGHAAHRDIRNHYLFEIATEVANRVGGIYSVIKSKAPVTTAEYGDRYTLIGPLNRQSAAVEVEALTPTNPQLAATIESMEERGIGIVYGRWLIEGAPRVILIDTKTAYRFLDEWKADLWNTAGIPSPPGDDETNEAVVFGYLVAWFLGEPDGVLPNGLNVTKFSAMHEFQNLHQQSKEKIHDFVRGHFYGHNDFDPENTLYLFTAGRYEYRNKGVDMFIEALARLNHRLKAAGSKMTIVAFIIMPAQTQSLTVEALKGQAVIKSLRDTVDIIEQGVGKKIFERALKWHEGDALPDEKDLITSQDKILLRRRLFAMKRHGLPPIVTHNMANDAEDPILNQIRRVQLFNHPSDRVKIVFHPEFLNSANPVLSMDYDEFVRGTHLGFGCYMEELIENSTDYGIYIVDRRMKGVDDSVNQLTSFMYDFAGKSRRQRINQRNRTERLSDLLDWKRMGMEYVKARQLALRRAYPASFDSADEDDFIPGVEQKISRPFSVPGSPRDRSGMMTPGDFASLQEGREGLSTEDYVAWKLPEEEDPEEYPFPLTLRSKKSMGPTSPAEGFITNGSS